MAFFDRLGNRVQIVLMEGNVQRSGGFLDLVRSLGPHQGDRDSRLHEGPSHYELGDGALAMASDISQSIEQILGCLPLFPLVNGVIATTIRGIEIMIPPHMARENPFHENPINHQRDLLVLAVGP